jgi:hypothetical protein
VAFEVSVEAMRSSTATATPLDAAGRADVSECPSAQSAAMTLADELQAARFVETRSAEMTIGHQEAEATPVFPTGLAWA